MYLTKHLLLLKFSSWGLFVLFRIAERGNFFGTFVQVKLNLSNANTLTILISRNPRGYSKSPFINLFNESFFIS